MASLPSPTQVSGKHNAIYEAYYKQVDPKGTEVIEAMNAAKFLKKSGLSDVVLSRIWDLSDPKGLGYLDKSGLFVALKLVALAQHGHDINMRNIFMEPPNPPKVGDIPKIIPQAIKSVPASNTDWSMKPADKLKYQQLFDSLQPVNGLIAGNKVKGVLMDSKLPLETLGRIWDLADQDKDGNLDKHEFTVAMHLVYQALDKRAVPTTLPPELQKPKGGVGSDGNSTTIPKAPSGEGFGDGGGFVANFPTDIAPPPPVPPLPVNMPLKASVIPPASQIPLILPGGGSSSLTSSKLNLSSSGVSGQNWVVTPHDRIRFEAIFRDCDKDKDGLVCGLEIKNVFLQSGVPQHCLAHIWALCDTNQSGKLTVEQFALAMWMVEQKKKGIEPPEVLAPNMIPPSLRGGIVPGIEMPITQPEPQPKYSNPELEMIAKEIDELFKERHLLETDIAQKEADIRIKTGEIRSLQSELDTLAATLKQLENQKGEAQKRLDDLTVQVSKIREQCLKQEETINEQEGELNTKRSELQKLKDEELALEQEYETHRKEVENLSKQLQDKQFQISQVKAMVTQLLESQRQMNDAVLLCKAAIEAKDAYLVSDYSLKIEADFHEAKLTLQRTNEPLKSSSDPFNDAAANTTQTTNILHNNATGGFGSVVAAAHSQDAFATNGFGTTDPFGDGGNAVSMKAKGFDDSFMNAPLSGFDDAFGSSASFSSAATNQTKDPFTSSNADPFGDKKVNTTTTEAGKDDFGSDPFAILHAPTTGGQILSPNPSNQKSGPPPRPESPSPALPPKKSKQPPPRPAPPRPLQGPTRPAPPVTTTTSDPFSSSSTGGFADFADFDNKQAILVPPPASSLSFLLSDDAKRTSAIKINTLKSRVHQPTTVVNNSTTIPTPVTFATATTTTTTTSVQQPHLLELFSTSTLQNDASKNISIELDKSKQQTVTRIIPTPRPQPPLPTTTKTSTSSAAVAAAPTDFVDDPFKDYRYEDPFNIKDPFDFDDDDDDNVEDDDENGNGNGNAVHGYVERSSSAKATFEYESKLKLTGAGNLNDNSHRSNNNNNNKISKDFFEMFDDNFEKFGDNKILKTKNTNATKNGNDDDDDRMKNAFNDSKMTKDVKNSAIAAKVMTTNTTTATVKRSAEWDDFLFSDDDDDDDFKAISSLNTCD